MLERMNKIKISAKKIKYENEPSGKSTTIIIKSMDGLSNIVEMTEN
jgi:hypothetical protein